MPNRKPRYLGNGTLGMRTTGYGRAPVTPRADEEGAGAITIG
jgi:hypothetical protein